jgi:hypothetical protein
LRNASKNFLQQHKLSFYQRPNGKYQITGDFFKKDNLVNYSAKYTYTLNYLETLVEKNNGHVFIYSHLVEGTGTRTIGEILQRNGYMEYSRRTAIELRTKASKAHRSSQVKRSTGGKKTGVKRSASSKTGQFANIRCYFCGVMGKDHIDRIDHDYSPARYVIVDGLIEDRLELKSLFDVFNSKANRDCRVIKILVGSQIMREAVDLKRINHVIMVSFDNDFPTMEQVIGRAVRHCSHADLPPEKRYTSVVRLVASLPKDSATPKIKQTVEEQRYSDAELRHIEIKKIERILKEISIDCTLNKAGNVFEVEKEHYKGCRGPGEGEKSGSRSGGIKCTPQCDYMECDYTCASDKKGKKGTKDSWNIDEIPGKKLDTTTFEAYYYQKEIERILAIVRKLFKISVIWDHNTIANAIKQTDGPAYFDVRYLDRVLEILVGSALPVYNTYGQKGHVIIAGPQQYMFQPDYILDEQIPWNIRNTDAPKDTKTSISVGAFLSRKYAPKDTDQSDEIYRKVSEKISKFDIQSSQDTAQIARIIGNLTYHEQILLLEKAIEIHQKKNISRPEKEFVMKVFRPFAEYLVEENQFRGKYNYKPLRPLVSRLYSLSGPTSKNEEPIIRIVGHLLGKDPRCYQLGQWNECYYDIITQKVRTPKYTPAGFIFGYMDISPTGKMQFKLQYIRTTKTKDKRKILKGFVCSQHGNKKELFDIARKLGMNVSESNIKTVDRICTLIELKLRELEIQERKKKTVKKWFYEYIEYQRAKSAGQLPGVKKAVAISLRRRAVRSPMAQRV